MVGTIEPRKGHRVAIDAFEQLWNEGLDVDLVVVGKSGWESKQLIDRLQISSHSRQAAKLACFCR